MPKRRGVDALVEEKELNNNNKKQKKEKEKQTKTKNNENEKKIELDEKTEASKYTFTKKSDRLDKMISICTGGGGHIGRRICLQLALAGSYLSKILL